MLSVLELLERDGYTFAPGDHYRTCHQHDSLVVDLRKNRYFWNSRGESGDSIDYLRNRDNLTFAEALAYLGELPDDPRPPRPTPGRETEAPSAEQLASLTGRAEFYHSTLTAQARAYWHSQGISDESITRFRLGYTDRCPLARHTASYTIPYWNWDTGRVINLRHRLIDESKGRYRPEFKNLGNSLFDAGPARPVALLDTGEALLVEGEKKAIVLSQHGIRAFAWPGLNTWGPEFARQIKEAGIRRVYIGADPLPRKSTDRKKAVKALKRIRADLEAAGVRATIAYLPGKPDDLLTGGLPAAALLALARNLKPFTRSPESQARRDRIRAEVAERKAARAEELTQRRQADSALVFLGDEDIDPAEVRQARALFTSAKKWQAYCEHKWPDLDSERQYQIKLAENREARPAQCGEEHWRTLPNGEVKKVTWHCGLCDRCLSMQVSLYRRALNQIMGLSVDSELDDFSALVTEAMEGQGIIDRRGEAAPPLARIHGPLNLVTMENDPDRLNFARKLRRLGIRYRCLPVKKDGAIQFDFIVNSDEWGDPLGVMATDHRLSRWAAGVMGKRASGDLLPSLKALEARYRDPLPYEVILPELDDSGSPVDPDIFFLSLPSIGTVVTLPEIAIEFEVKSPESLQAALLAIHKEQVDKLTKRGMVIYGVGSFKKFYTRYSTMPGLLREFNQNNDRIKAKERGSEDVYDGNGKPTA